MREGEDLVGAKRLGCELEPEGETPRDLGRGKDADEVWVSLLLTAITEISLVAFVP